MELQLGQEYSTEKGEDLRVIRLRQEGDLMVALARGLDGKSGERTYNTKFWRLVADPDLGAIVKGPFTLHLGGDDVELG